jgi:glycosyltransferase involved in cell wall biosynthesis
MPAGKPLHVHALIDSLGWGGAEKLLADFARGAQEAGIEVSVGFLADRADAADELRELGIEPQLVEIATLLGKADRKLVRDHLAEVRPDILHTHLGNSDFLGGLAARALGIPTVSTLHVTQWTDSFRDRVKSWIIALGRRRCAYRVIAVSDAQRRLYLRPRWDRAKHVVTVHNGIVGDVRPGSGARVREQLGLGENDLVVAIVGVLREGKGHRAAIEAVEMLRERFPQLRLLIVGDGPIRADVERMAESAGEAAMLTGYREDVLDVIDAVDVILQPSEFDALPTSLMEAMAARVPAVATAVGGIPEIVVPDQTGILIDPPADGRRIADALGPLLADPERRAEMGRAGRERFEAHFTERRWLERLTHLYEEAIAAQGSRR